MQQTVTMDAKIELTHHVAEYDARHMDTKYETHLEEEKTNDTKSVDTYMNNAEMLADSTHLQDMNEAYPKMATVSTTDDAQHCLIYGQSIPRAFFINKALPEVFVIQTGDAISLIYSTSAIIKMEAKEETKRGIQFLHISDDMPRRSGTITVARRPHMPDAALKKKKKEPNVQETLCQEDMRDETCLHIIDAPETHHDAGMHADNTYKEEAIDKTCPEKGKHDMPRTTVHDILNTKSNHNNSWQTSPRQEFAATLAIYDEEFAAATTLATHDKEFATATLAIYDEEFATLASHDEEFAAAATIATYDEEFAAAATLERGALGGITKCTRRFRHARSATAPSGQRRAARSFNL
jgi:hypothetical protein